MKSSVCRLSSPNTNSYVREQNVGSTRKFVIENYLLFTCITNQILALCTPVECGYVGGSFLDSGKEAPPAHMQWVYFSVCRSICPSVCLSACLQQTRYKERTVGFSQNGDIVALVHKNPLYVECTRYSCNILLIYLKYAWARKHNSTMVLILHLAPLPQRWTKILFLWLMCLPTVHGRRMATWNIPIQPLLMEIWGGTVRWVMGGFGVGEHLTHD